MLIDDFNHTIDTWIKALDEYDFNQLCAKPSSTSWSLGQMYMHLIEDTSYYIEQIKICLSNNDNATAEALPNARAMFANNSFPDEIIEGAPSNQSIPQPKSKEQLLYCLQNIKTEMNTLATFINQNLFKGKTKHPGLGYFSANEWLQFADMHFRHHLRQKKRINDFLKMGNTNRDM